MAKATYHIPTIAGLNVDFATALLGIAELDDVENMEPSRIGALQVRRGNQRLNLKGLGAGAVTALYRWYAPGNRYLVAAHGNDLYVTTGGVWTPVRVYWDGTVSVTNGSTTVTGTGTAWDEYVQSGDIFVGPDGQRYEIAAVVSATEIRLASAYADATATGQSYSIRPSITSGQRWCFVPWLDSLLCLNGADNPLRFDGTRVYRIGYRKPGSAPTATAVAGSGLEIGTYKYKVAYEYETGNSAPCDAEATVTTSTGNQQVELSNIPIGPAGVTGRTLYRTRVDGAIFYYLGRIADNTTTTYSDITPDAELLDEMPTDIDEVPKARFLVHYQGRYVYARTADKPNRLWFTDVGDPNIVRVESFRDIGGGHGDPIHAVLVWQAQLWIFTTHSIWRIFDVAEPEYAQIVQVVPRTEYIWPETVVPTPHGIVFVAGWTPYVLVGDGIQPLGGAPKVMRYLQQYANVWRRDEAAAVYYGRQDSYKLAYEDERDNTNHNSRILNFHWRANGWTVHSGIPAKCWAVYEGPEDTGELVWGSAETGTVYVADTGFVDDGAVFTSKLQLRTNNLGYPGRWKTLKHIEALARAQRDPIDVWIEGDRGQLVQGATLLATEDREVEYAFILGQSRLGDRIGAPGSVVEGVPQLLRLRVRKGMTAREFGFRFERASSTDWEIYAVTLEFDLRGRR